MTRHPSLLIILAFMALLQSCGTPSNRFRLEGEFKNMNQAEFYLYDAASGKKDTIHVQRGRFLYETAFEDTATLMLMFPNFSQIPIFASSGITVEVKGDASQLRETKVKGSKENDEMTAFRLKGNQLTPPEMANIAANYIVEEPLSPVSFYLLQQYFVKSLDPDYLRALQLCNLMLEANPRNMPLQRLRSELKILSAGHVGRKLPVFAVFDTRGKVVTNKDLQAKVNVVCLWSSWNYDSHSQMNIVRKLLKDHKKDLSALGIGVDAHQSEGRSWMKRDSINFPVICDGKMFDTPLAKSLGMTDVPFNIVADQRGIIIARNIPTKEFQKKLEELLQK